MEIGYYCPKCNKVYPSCWEFDNELICSVCFCESKIKLITLENLRAHLKVIPFKNNVLQLFKEKYENNNTNPYNPKFTEKEKIQIMNILNKGLRKEKLEQIMKNIK